MSSSWLLPVASSFFISFFEQTAAQPVAAYPFNSQLPLVARLSEPFSYTIAQQTFTSDFNISYSLNDAPKWLSVEETTGTLNGTPGDDDLGSGEITGVDFEIVATDSDGTASMPATIVVSKSPEPRVQKPLAQQIGEFGDRSAPDSLISYPDSDFSFTFDPETFSPSQLHYYATSGDNSPLPSWMKFDQESLTFSGKTPLFENLIQPPQTFDFRLVGSDIEGFSATSVPFSVVVGSRKLTIDNPVITINTTRGESVSYDGLSSDVKLDDATVDTADLSVSTKNMPSWLSFDDQDWSLSGTSPSDAQSTNSTISFSSALSDTLDVQVQIVVATDIFRKTISSIEATPGKDFRLDLEPYFWDPDQVTLEVETDPEQEWLGVKGLVLSGTPPESSDSDSDIRITIKARTEAGDSETESVALKMRPVNESTSTTSEKSTPSSTSPPSETSSEAAEGMGGGDSGEKLNGGQIALAVILPIMAIVALILLFILLRRHREKKRQQSDRDGITGGISGPIPGSFVQNGSMTSDDPDAVETVKAYNAIPPPMPTYRPGQKGYLRAALHRVRSTRTASSFDSEDSQPDLDKKLEAPKLPALRAVSISDYALTGARNSWLTEEGHVGMSEDRRRSNRLSHSSLLSLYESMRNFPSRDRYLRGQTEGSFRSTLDVMIPATKEEPESLLDLDEAGMPRDNSQILPVHNISSNSSDKGKAVAGSWQRRSRQQKPGPVPMPPPMEETSDVLASAPLDQSSPLRSHPTHGQRFPTPSAGMFKVYTDSSARGTEGTFETVSGSEDINSIVRMQSRGSDLNSSRPMSRKSDASTPWFGGRKVSVAPPLPEMKYPRSPYPDPKRFHLKTDSESGSPPASIDLSAEDSAALDTEPNWQAISRDSTTGLPSGAIEGGGAGTRARSRSQGQSSPFYPRSNMAPPRPPKSVRRPGEAAIRTGSPGSSGKENSNLGSSASGLSGSNRSVGISGRAKPEKMFRIPNASSRGSRGSSPSLMGSAKWGKVRQGHRTPLAERPATTMRMPQSAALSKPQLSGGSGWTTDSGPMERDDSGMMKRATVGGDGSLSSRNGRAAPPPPSRVVSRADAKAGGSGDFPIFI